MTTPARHKGNANPPMKIVHDTAISDPRVVRMLQDHLDAATAQTGPGCAHALDADALRHPDIALWTAWEDDTLAGTGATKRLTPEHREIKSMFVAPAFRRRGVGQALINHILRISRDDGVTRLSLETGSWDYFAPARAFYLRHGFTSCPPFGNYRADPNSVWMTRALSE